MSNKLVSEMTDAEIREMCGAARSADDIYREIADLRREGAVIPTAPAAERLVYWEAEAVRQARRRELWDELEIGRAHV